MENKENQANEPAASYGKITFFESHEAMEEDTRRGMAMMTPHERMQTLDTMRKQTRKWKFGGLTGDEVFVPIIIFKEPYAV